MNAWVVRGLVLAALNVAVRAVVGFAIGQWPMQGTPIRLLSLLLVILAAGVWGYVDSRRDRAANPNSEDGADLLMLWLKAGVLGGLAAGALAWLIDKFPNFDLGDNPLFFELTAGAAFTILLIFVPGMTGVGIGRFLANRAEDKAASSAPQRTREPVGVGAGGYSESASHRDSSYDDSAYDDSIFPAQRRGDADAVTEEFPAVTDRSENGKST
jgi:hypothetical protein